MGIHHSHQYFFTNYRFLTFKISTLGFSFLVLSGLRPVWRVSVGNSCCHPVLDAALGLQLDQILLVGQLSRCRLLIQPQSSMRIPHTLLLLLKYAMLWPHLTRSERFPIPSWCFFIPRVLWRPAQLFSHLSALWLSRLGSLLPFSQWQLYQSIYFLNFLNIATGTGAIWYKYNELYHIAPVPNLLIFLHQLPSNCTLYCKKQNNQKCCKKKPRKGLSRFD